MLYLSYTLADLGGRARHMPPYRTQFFHFRIHLCQKAPTLGYHAPLTGPRPPSPPPPPPREILDPPLIQNPPNRLSHMKSLLRSYRFVMIRLDNYGKYGYRYYGTRFSLVLCITFSTQSLDIAYIISRYPLHCTAVIVLPVQ